MGSPRTVVITGAARGLGFASAVRLYREGWQVVAAMRTPDRGMPLLHDATGAGEGDDRLIGVQLDLMDQASVSAAAKAIEERVGAPYAVVHNAGISSAGMAEETDIALWQRMFATHVIGPVALTNALLPSMRTAGEGRIVLVCSSAGVRGQPATAPYSASKGAMERWGESLASEIAPFGLGVTVLITGTYDTEIITDAGTTDDRYFGGPYARLHQTMDTRGRFAMKLARSPERFADGLVKALADRGPFRRHGVGPDASVMPMLGAANRQEDRFPDPDTFDLSRESRSNLGWGYGVHVCLGMHLARLEMRTAVNLLLDRLPNLRMDPDGDDPHIRGQVFRSPTSLPVLFDPQ